MPRTFRLAIAAALLFALSLVSGCSDNAAWTRGKELLAAGKPAEAAVELRTALKTDAENPEIMLDLGKAVAATISGETYTEFEGLVAALSAKGKRAEAGALETEAFENGKDAFIQGDHGLAGLAIKFFNAGDNSLELPVLWAMKGNAALIRAHYPSLQMQDKAERFAGEISWSADDIAGAEAAIALHELDKHPAIAEQLATKLNFMLNSDLPQSVELARTALESGDFDPGKVLVFFKSAFLSGQPGGPMRKAGFEHVLKHDAQYALQQLMNGLTAIAFRPEESCLPAMLGAAGELTVALGSAEGKAAITGPLSGQRGNFRNSILLKAIGAAAGGTALKEGSADPAECLKTWQALKVADEAV